MTCRSVRHIPEWLPWLSYKPLARVGHNLGNEVLYPPLRFVKESIVSYIYLDIIVHQSNPRIHYSSMALRYPHLLLSISKRWRTLNSVVLTGRRQRKRLLRF